MKKFLRIKFCRIYLNFIQKISKKMKKPFKFNSVWHCASRPGPTWASVGARSRSGVARPRPTWAWAGISPPRLGLNSVRVISAVGEDRTVERVDRRIKTARDARPGRNLAPFAFPLLPLRRSDGESEGTAAPRRAPHRRAHPPKGERAAVVGLSVVPFSGAGRGRRAARAL